jgi:integrase
VTSALAVVAQPATEIVELRDLAERAREYAYDSKSPATRRAYAADLRDFEGWCARRGVVAYPLGPAVAALYLTSQAETKALATIVRRRTAIALEHKRRGLDGRPFAHEQVDEVWKGIRRRLGAVPQNAKDALLIADLRRALEPLGSRILDVRDRALLLVGFAGAFRRSEIVGLDVGDVRFVDAGLEITLRRSKTDQEGAGRLVGLPFGSRLETCPVRALRAWLDASGVDAGPLFRGVRGGVSSSRLTGAMVAIIAKRRAAAIGLDPSRLAGHSLRAGFATSAALAGVTETFIAAQTGHKSMTILRRYIRPATVWQNNAAAAVGL